MTTPETNAWNGTDVDWGACMDTTGTVSYCSAKFVLLTITLVLIDILVIVGNTLVILAVVLMPRLRTVTNIFIVSLAFSDLLLGVFVLPFSLTRQAMGYWVFPEFWCPLWLVTDVWVCTASILNLCIISFDRYIAITRPIQYPNIITHLKGKVLVAVVWIASFAISFPPLIGWNDWQQTSTGSQATVANATEISGIFEWNQTLQDRRAPIGRVETNYTLHYNDGMTTTSPLTHLKQCELNSVRGYRVYSALGSFFIPAIILVFFYYRIYRAARRTAISISKGRLNCKSNAADGVLTLRVHRGGGSERTNATPSPARNASPDILSRTYKPTAKSVPDGQPLIEPLLNGHNKCNDGGVIQEMGTRNDPNSNLEKSRSQSISSDSIHGDQQTRTRHFSFLPSATRPQTKPLLRRIRRETKAAKTLGIIVGCFLFCWMPFFTVYFIEAFCAGCITPLSFDITFWIGYCNSMLNPCIYAMFSRDFRFAFKKLLCFDRKCTDSKWVTTFPMKSSSRKSFARPDLVSESSERAK